MTLKASQSILEESKLDRVLSIRLAGVTDLIAAEAKYHLACRSSFKRSTEKTKIESQTKDLALIWLCSELKYSAEKGHVLKLSDVWERYMELAEQAHISIPNCFISRRSTFRQKLQEHVGSFLIFVQPQGGPAERETLLLPDKFAGTAIADLAAARDDDEQMSMPYYDHQEDIYLGLVHVALKLRGDLIKKPGHSGLNVDEESALSCIPDSLFMFLKLLFGGPCQLEGDGSTSESEEESVKQRVLNTAQDIIYGVSNGQKMTPKHIGLASTLHQATRSKELVNMFYRAGHTMSYTQTIQMDTALAENTLKSMDISTGAVISPNLVPNKFVQFTADNIDILDKTLDGKDTFHATQVAAWQRSSDYHFNFEGMSLANKRSLNVPEIMNTLLPVTMPVVKPTPKFSQQVLKCWYQIPESKSESVKRAEASDIAFHLFRQKSVITSSWTIFNESITQTNPERTTVGYLPIIQAPAHEYDTLNTDIKRCMQETDRLHQKHTVITVDQALYCKLMELKWCNPEYGERLIPRLGGLHIGMNFLKVIGKHMQGSGLVEAWVESGILGPNVTDKVFDGKHYKKAVRTHKITLQALWTILLPKFLDFLSTADNDLSNEVSCVSERITDVETLIELLNSERFLGAFNQFIERKREDNVNFEFWWGYMEMVSVLLMFTRAQRDGLWDLHLNSFAMMLPYFFRYDHYNYGRWGPIYLAEMKTLPDEVLQEFLEGNFVIKRSDRKFNQVDPDQAQEWLNGTGKRCGGIVGITKYSTALSRWALSYNLRSQIAENTKEMYRIQVNDDNHNESKPGREERDNKDEKALLSLFQQFQVLDNDLHPSNLQSIATKDVSTDLIQDSLLLARSKGQAQMEEFIEQRLITSDSIKTCSIYDPIKRNNPPTFETLYELSQNTGEKNKATIMKADRNFLRRIVTAYAARRFIDLDLILQHELMHVPVSLAEMNGNLRTGNKSMLADILTKDINCPESLDLRGQSSCLIIDGQARVLSLGRPAYIKTFGDFANVFMKSVFQSGESYSRIDIVFDRYRDESIKETTRHRRTKTTRPIRRVIEGRDVPFPKSWANFIALNANKADLARFLSEELLANAPPNKEIIVGGGFEDEHCVRSSCPASDMSTLAAAHEEADTRIILHAIHANCNSIVVSARDTDVLILLIAHFRHISCNDLWMMTGTSAKRRYLPIQKVFQNLPAHSVDSLLAFHALTGCDTTSFLYGHSKKSFWPVFLNHYDKLANVGNTDFNPAVMEPLETFVCRLYGMENVNSADKVRSVMFPKSSKQEMLPPTCDAIQFHFRRTHYQTCVWKQANIPLPTLPDPCQMGWKRDGTGLHPILMELDPIPDFCIELVTCSCKTGCRTLRCKCRKTKLLCMSSCDCKSKFEEGHCFNN